MDEVKNINPSSGVSGMELIHMIYNVRYNCKSNRQKQFERAKEARLIYHIIGNTTPNNYNHLLRHNIIKNFPVIIENVNLVENISGPRIGLLKGNITRQNTNPIKEYVVKIPP